MCDNDVALVSRSARASPEISSDLCLAWFLLYAPGMRLGKTLGISVCLLLAIQLDCSSSKNGRKVDGGPDGAPGDGSRSYDYMSSPDSSDGSIDTGRDASIESAPTGFEVGPETAVDLHPKPDIAIPNDTAMPDLLLDVPTGSDLPAPSNDAYADAGSEIADASRCVDGTCTGICVPGTLTCRYLSNAVGNYVERCSDDATTWVEMETCSGSTPTCFDGKCMAECLLTGNNCTAQPLSCCRGPAFCAQTGGTRYCR